MLPNYRGVKPVFWVLKNNESTTGVTIHIMDEGIDTGDILNQKQVVILPHDTVDSLTKRLSKTGSILLSDTINDIKSNNYELKKQDIQSVTYFSQPGRNDLIQFKKQGKKFY